MRIMRTILIALISALTILGMTLATPTATAALSDNAKGWAQIEYRPNDSTGDSTALMPVIGTCSPLVSESGNVNPLRIHSALLIDRSKTVQLYSASGCAANTLVAVLTAVNPCDSGTDPTGNPTLLGVFGATHYAIT